jgi:hypothetical protein
MTDPIDNEEDEEAAAAKKRKKAKAIPAKATPTAGAAAKRARELWPARLSHLPPQKLKEVMADWRHLDIAADTSGRCRIFQRIADARVGQSVRGLGKDEKVYSR